MAPRPNILHLLITRFNLSNHWDSDKNHKTVLDEQWLEERFGLFEQYCFPSIQGQTNTRFTWWVFFDTNTPAKYRSRIEGYGRSCANFRPRFKPSFQAYQEELSGDVGQEMADSGADLLITTRLDNDDALATDTIDIIQRTAKRDQKCLLEIPIGYNLAVSHNPALRRLHYPLNHFLSLVEPRECGQFETVYGRMHGEWRDLPSYDISGRPQWIQVVHRSNVFNDPKGELILDLGKFRRFSIAKPAFSWRYRALVCRKRISRVILRFLPKTELH